MFRRSPFYHIIAHFVYLPCCIFPWLCTNRPFQNRCQSLPGVAPVQEDFFGLFCISFFYLSKQVSHSTKEKKFFFEHQTDTTLAPNCCLEQCLLAKIQEKSLACHLQKVLNNTEKAAMFLSMKMKPLI